MAFTCDVESVDTSESTSIPTSGSRDFKPDLVPILYDFAHVAGWDPYNPYGLAHVSYIDSALNKSCTTYPNDRENTAGDLRVHHDMSGILA